VVEMRSNEFDTYLMLEDDRGELIAQNDDDSPILTTHALKTRMTFRAPRDATYRLIATTFSPTSLGNYTISVREVPILNYFADRLTATDEERNDCYIRGYEVALIAGRRYFIDLESNDFATSVKLLNSNGAILTFDVAEMEMNTRIAGFQAPMTGMYRIVVTSAAERRTGAFTLTLREEE